MSDLIERLRAVAALAPNSFGGSSVVTPSALLTEAADLLASQAATVEDYNNALAEIEMAMKRLVKNLPSIVEDHVCGGTDTRPIVDVDGLVGALTENVMALSEARTALGETK